MMQTYIMLVCVRCVPQRSEERSDTGDPTIVLVLVRIEAHRSLLLQTNGLRATTGYLSYLRKGEPLMSIMPVGHSPIQLQESC